MGSHSWIRDEKKKRGGTSQVVGVPVVVPLEQTKRKLVWKREEGGEENISCESSSKKTKIDEEAAKRKKLLELKAKIEEKEKLLKERKLLQEQNNENEEMKIKEEDRLRGERKAKFEAGFADAFESARKSFAADLQSSKKAIVFADQEEINRILNSKSDYGVLKLSPGSSGAELRKRYREMALSCHPDKCKHPQAQEAFRKIVQSYKSLSKYLAD